MRAKEFTHKKDQQVDEILPALGAVAGGLGRAALAGGSMLARGLSAAGSAAARGASAIGSAVGQGVKSAAGQAAGQAFADPALVAKQTQAMKTELQAEVKAKQDELLLLKQQLAKLT